MKHFCNRKKICSFLEEWDEEVFLILGEVGTVPKWDKNPERTQKGRLLVYRLQQKWHKSRFGRKVE